MGTYPSLSGFTEGCKVLVPTYLPCPPAGNGMELNPKGPGLSEETAFAVYSVFGATAAILGQPTLGPFTHPIRSLSSAAAIGSASILLLETESLPLAAVGMYHTSGGVLIKDFERQNYRRPLRNLRDDLRLQHAGPRMRIPLLLILPSLRLVNQGRKRLVPSSSLLVSCLDYPGIGSGEPSWEEVVASLFVRRTTSSQSTSPHRIVLSFVRRRSNSANGASAASEGHPLG